MCGGVGAVGSRRPQQQKLQQETECKTKVDVSFGLYLSHYKCSSNYEQAPTQTQADELTNFNYSVAAGLQTLVRKEWKQRTSASLVCSRRKILFSKKGSKKI